MRLLGAALLAIGFVLTIWGGGFGLAQVLPTDHWRQPLAPQGEAPREWTPLDRSLKPEDCGVCHAEELAQWRTSLHAKAFSPGLVGQLLSYDAEDTAACMQCHAPAAEQRQAFEAARSLPPAMQDDVARLIMAMTGEELPVVQLTAEEEASFEESLAQAERGDFATDDQIRAIWAKHGL